MSKARNPFPAIRDHVLLPAAGPIAEADERLAAKADPVRGGQRSSPTDWADGEQYAEFLTRRLEAPRDWVP